MKISNQAGRMVAEDLELTVETLRCKEADRDAGGLVKKVLAVVFSLKKNSLKKIIFIQASLLCDIYISEVFPIDAKSGSASGRFLQQTTFNPTEFQFGQGGETGALCKSVDVICRALECQTEARAQRTLSRTPSPTPRGGRWTSYH